MFFIFTDEFWAGPDPNSLLDKNNFLRLQLFLSFPLV